MEIKIYNANLHTKGLEEECVPGELEGKELWKQIYDFMDGEEAFVAPSPYKKGEYAFLGLENSEKNKELHWLIEQDDMIGVYSNREEFNQIWDSGKYEPEGCMYIDAKNIEIIRELRKVKQP